MAQGFFRELWTDIRGGLDSWASPRGVGALEISNDPETDACSASGEVSQWSDLLLHNTAAL